ncbi:MAG TPA: M56 family metallopeptidase [Vicinamibacterales bacterium]|nr:M56 family metallopeptidase [Vicinamibacterales bacterium]
MSAWTYVAGWALVHFVWQGACIAVLTALVLHMCRHRSASVRYLIACGAMVAMLLAVTITGALIQPSDPGHRPEVRTVQKQLIRTSDVLLPIAIDDGPTVSVRSAVVRVEAFLPWIVSTWLAGVLLLLARVAAGWWRVRRLHHLALSAMRSSWQHAADRIAGRLELARVIRIVELSAVDVPLVVGCLRPIVVLPIAALSQLNAAQVEAILAHELAHVQRHDYVVNLMQTVAETLLFYHPAVWWLSARIRDEREHCCDDVAIAVCGDAAGYAAALTELEAWRSGELSLAAAATGGSLVTRIRRILRVEISEDSRTSAVTVGLVALALAGAVGMNILAQSAPAETPTFEVASVRPNTSGDNKMMSQTLPGGRYNGINIPPRLLIMNSYGLQEQQLVGAPPWISSERFDIVAKADGDLGPPVSRDGPSKLQLMIRALLEDRFKLKVHREPRDVQIYALVLARPDGRLGSGLTVSTVNCEALAAARRNEPPRDMPKPGERPQCGARVGFGELMTGGQPMLELVSLLSATVGRSVVDRTGLTGRYDITLRWTPDRVLQRAAGTAPSEPIRVNGVEIDPNGPSIFTALQEQLGLKLESERGTVEALVIDHIERPTPD